MSESKKGLIEYLADVMSAPLTEGEHKQIEERRVLEMQKIETLTEWAEWAFKMGDDYRVYKEFYTKNFDLV